jgi:hypothetical protein
MNRTRDLGRRVRRDRRCCRPEMTRRKGLVSFSACSIPFPDGRQLRLGLSMKVPRAERVGDRRLELLGAHGFGEESIRLAFSDDVARHGQVCLARQHDANDTGVIPAKAEEELRSAAGGHSLVRHDHVDVGPFDDLRRLARRAGRKDGVGLFVQRQPHALKDGVFVIDEEDHGLAGLRHIKGYGPFEARR